MSGGTLPENELVEQIPVTPPADVPAAPEPSYNPSDVDLIDRAYGDKR